MKRYNSGWFVGLILLLSSPVTAQEQARRIIKPEVNYNAAPVPYELGGITINGIPGMDEKLLQEISGLTVGQTIYVPGLDGEINKAVRKYWKQGLFSDVKVNADSIIGNKIYISIQLEARPRISRLTYHGVKKSEKEDIEKQLGLKEGNQINPSMIDRAKYLIKKYFEEKGYSKIAVDIFQQDDVTEHNKVLVDININKNQKTKVHRIYFTGVEPQMINKLKGSMKKTKESTWKNFLKSKKFLTDKYKEDKGFVIDKLNEWGYRDAVITSDTVIPFDEKHVDIHMTIDKGQKYYIRNINWVGNSIYPTESLAQIFKMHHGDVYNQAFLKKRLFEDEDAVSKQYYNNGYLFSQITPVEVNVVGDSIDLEMRVIEGKQAHLNKVRISGNTRVFENVIRRELRTKPGDLFSSDAIQRSMREIQTLGHFDPEKIDFNYTPNETNGTVDISYGLTPKASDQIELSAGWGQTGIIGKVSLKFTNFSIQNMFKGKNRRGFLPQGDGQTLSISAQTNADYYQQYSISFVDPWFGGKRPNQFSVSAFYSKQTDVSSNYYNSSYYNNYYNYYGYTDNSSSYANYYDPDKYVKMIGASIGWGKRLRWPDDYFTFLAELSYTRYMLKSWQYFIITDGNCNNVNLNFSLNRNSTDNTFYPRRGSEFSFTASFTPPFSLWDGKNYKELATNSESSTYQAEMQEKYRWVEYHKWKFKLKTYTALNGRKKSPVLMTRSEFGLLGHYNKYKKSPFETFYVGGDGMSGYSSGYATEMIGLRGYENGSLTPTGYEGYAYSRFSLELRYPLMLETSTSIYASAFLEGGNAWTDVRKFNPFEMKRSAGVGVRVFLPMIGLLGVDWAYGFDKVFGSKSYGGSRFHFVIGQEF